MAHSNAWNTGEKGYNFWRSGEYPDIGYFYISVMCTDFFCFGWKNATFSDCLWKQKQGKRCLLNYTRTKKRPGNRKHLWESQETANSTLLTPSQARKRWQLLKLQLQILQTMRQCDPVQVYLHRLLLWITASHSFTNLLMKPRKDLTTQKLKSSFLLCLQAEQF